MMANTATGSYRTTSERSMAAFDKLPPEVRRALADSVEDWVAQPVLTRIRKHRGPDRIRYWVKQIRQWDRNELAQREDQRRRAIGPYKGMLKDPDYKPKKRRRKQ